MYPLVPLQGELSTPRLPAISRGLGASSSSWQGLQLPGTEERRIPPTSQFRLVAACGLLLGLIGATSRRTILHPRRVRGHRPTASTLRRAAKDAAGGTVPATGKADRKVVLMGDSVLDNFFWLETPERHLRVVLEESLQASKTPKLASLRCLNLAVDQMSTFDFEEREPAVNSWDAYAKARQRVPFADDEDQRYLVDDDGKIRSVKNLERVKGTVDWVVLSIGGNDVYLNGNIQTSLALSTIPLLGFLREDVGNNFGGRFRDIVKAVKEAAPKAKLVLVIPYRPHRDFSLVYGAPTAAQQTEPQESDALSGVVRQLETEFLGDVVTPMVQQILAVAREEKCPVIDLSKTMDVACEEHYGTGKIGRVNSLGVAWSGAEPSDVSNRFISDLIAHAISNDSKPVVYRGVPRLEGNGWSLLIKEDANNALFAKDYKFGPSPQAARPRAGRRPPASSQDNLFASPGFWFGIGVLLTAVVNGASLLQGKDALFFDRSEYEIELKKQLAEDSASKNANV